MKGTVFLSGVFTVFLSLGVWAQDTSTAVSDSSVILYRPASTVPPPMVNDTSTAQKATSRQFVGEALRSSDEYIAGRMDGERDARASGLWFVAGLPGVCCYGIGVGGIGAAYLLPPSPPSAALIGKSGEYILGYTEGYKNSARAKNVRHATVGCLLGTLIEIGLHALVTMRSL